MWHGLGLACQQWVLGLPKRKSTLMAYRVPKGKHKIVELDDGSFVHLNTDSLIEVDHLRNSRIVRLDESATAAIVREGLVALGSLEQGNALSNI